MRVLGIDPGTHCGWALLDGESFVASGTLDLTPRRHEGGGMRFLRFRTAFAAMLADLGPGDVVAYEEVRRHLGTDAAHIYGGLVSQLSAECELRGVPYRGVPVATVKKLATGKGNADKAAMRAEAARRWGGEWPAKREDEADARFIALALAKELS